MSQGKVFYCDICNAVRGPSNHWLMAWITSGGTFMLIRWDESAANEDRITHLCGETCAATHLTRFVAKSREGK